MTETISKETVELAVNTLTGDVRDALLDRVKNLRKSWPELSEPEKRQLVEDLTKSAEHLVKEAVRVIASEGRKVITATLEKVTVKDKIQAVVSCSKSHSDRHDLIDAQGEDVLIVVAEVGLFNGEKAPVDIPRDQKELFNEGQEGDLEGADFGGEPEDDVEEDDTETGEAAAA